MGIVVTCANQKGGVAKSTTIGALAYILKEKGYKVLCIDLDPQRNLDMLAGKGVEIAITDVETPSILNVLTGRLKLEDIIISTPIGDLARASNQISSWKGNTAEITWAEFSDYKSNPEFLIQLIENRFPEGIAESENMPEVNTKGNADVSKNSANAHVLEQKIAEIRDQYDFIFIDTNPSLMLLTLNGLCAADYVLIPAFAEESSMQAIKELWDTIVGVLYLDDNKYLKVVGILLTSYKWRTNNARRYTKAISNMASQINSKVFNTKIRTSISVPESMGQKENVVLYDPSCKASIDYKAFAEEFLKDIARLEEDRNA